MHWKLVSQELFKLGIEMASNMGLFKLLEHGSSSCTFPLTKVRKVTRLQAQAWKTVFFLANQGREGCYCPWCPLRRFLLVISFGTMFEADIHIWLEVAASMVELIKQDTNIFVFVNVASRPRCHCNPDQVSKFQACWKGSPSFRGACQPWRVVGFFFSSASDGSGTDCLLLLLLQQSKKHQVLTLFVGFQLDGCNQFANYGVALGLDKLPSI